jgi:putative ABC transport system ATP-binding protein
MADKPQLSAEEIASEIEKLQQQMRSFALQRAEGLIDADLQRDLVKDIQARIVDLETQNGTHEPSSDDTSSNVDDVAQGGSKEARVINELFDKGDTFEQPKVSVDEASLDVQQDQNMTQEQSEVALVIEPSDSVEHSEAQVIEELFDKGDTFEQPKVTIDDEAVTAVDEPSPEESDTATDDGDSAHSISKEARVIEELFDKGDTFEQPKVSSPNAEPAELPIVSDVSEQLEHREAEVIEELFDKGDTFEQPKVTIDDEADVVEAQKVHEIPLVESTDTEADSSEEEPNFDDLVIEEDHSPFRRREENDSLAVGKLVDDVVVSSAMVKEPDYLDAIEPSRDSIHEPNVVDIREITKTYQMGELELEVLKGVTLQIGQGELVAIMGPSGSGKSTLMNILGALDKPTDGEYFLDAVDVSKMNEKQLAEVRNQKIGFVFQSFNLLKRTSAIRQVELPLIYGSHKDRTRLAREALEAVGLGQRLDHTPAELSGGQQQRVAIARALVSNPSLILADEPTGNLDSRSGTEVMQIFQNLNRKNNITTILVTHDVWIARHTDRVIMLRDGKIIADHHVKNPLVAGEAERPTETQELQAIFETTYYDGDEEEYT